MNKKRGFTLIELLVVIAIIGVLSSIVLAALGTARKGAGDSKVKGQLYSVRTAAEDYYSSHGYSYGSTVSNNCAAGMFADSASNLSRLTATASYPAGTTVVCNSGGTTYAVSANLSTSGQYWCVDSTGASKLEGAALPAGQNNCT